jgi:hypothetical protein
MVAAQATSRTSCQRDLVGGTGSSCSPRRVSASAMPTTTSGTRLIIQTLNQAPRAIDAAESTTNQETSPAIEASCAQRRRRAIPQRASAQARNHLPAMVAPSGPAIQRHRSRSASPNG